MCVQYKEDGKGVTDLDLKMIHEHETKIKK